MQRRGMPSTIFHLLLLAMMKRQFSGNSDLIADYILYMKPGDSNPAMV
jgi:hypothetical protein